VIDVEDIFDLVGSEAPFFELVDRFYEGVERTPALRALYPEDLEPGKKHLAWFLIQRFGGPSHFNINCGAPMLRRRHMLFDIDRAASGLWMVNMMAAVDAVPELAEYHTDLEHYFSGAAAFLINRPEPPTDGRLLQQA
jgi:hemoglobin